VVAPLPAASEEGLKVVVNPAGRPAADYGIKPILRAENLRRWDVQLTPTGRSFAFNALSGQDGGKRSPACADDNDIPRLTISVIAGLPSNIREASHYPHEDVSRRYRSERHSDESTVTNIGGRHESLSHLRLVR
jgi:hypothetical protein